MSFAGRREIVDDILQSRRHLGVTADYISRVSSWAVAGCFVSAKQLEESPGSMGNAPDNSWARRKS
jgi:hypothetical protein